MAIIINQKNYGRFSRLRWYDLIDDEDGNNRLGMRNLTFIARLRNTVDYKYWKILPKYEYRPDLIADLHYGAPELSWAITAYNEFFRPIQDYYADRRIKIPDANQLLSLLL
jgi:hypothetical protein